MKKINRIIIPVTVFSGVNDFNVIPLLVVSDEIVSFDILLMSLNISKTLEIKRT